MNKYSKALLMIVAVFAAIFSLRLVRDSTKKKYAIDYIENYKFKDVYFKEIHAESLGIKPRSYYGDALKVIDMMYGDIDKVIWLHSYLDSDSLTNNHKRFYTIKVNKQRCVIDTVLLDCRSVSKLMGFGDTDGNGKEEILIKTIKGKYKVDQKTKYTDSIASIENYKNHNAKSKVKLPYVYVNYEYKYSDSIMAIKSYENNGGTYKLKYVYKDLPEILNTYIPTVVSTFAFHDIDNDVKDELIAFS